MYETHETWNNHIEQIRDFALGYGVIVADQLKRPCLLYTDNKGECTSLRPSGTIWYITRTTLCRLLSTEEFGELLCQRASLGEALDAFVAITSNGEFHSCKAAFVSKR